MTTDPTTIQNDPSFRLHDESESPVILFRSGTVRHGATQTTEVVALLRMIGQPDVPVIASSLTIRIIAPVMGVEVSGRRVDQLNSTATWPIGDSSNAAMQDFTVTARACLDGGGVIEVTRLINWDQASSLAATGDGEPFASGDDLTLGQKVPNLSEAVAVGVANKKIVRDTPEFKALIRYADDDVVFKDEEGTGADKMMTKSTRDALKALAGLVKKEWPGKKVRVTEAWDEDDEHSSKSTHYEARAVDITVSDVDATKLGRLGRLAVNAGFDWVFYEDSSHVHASMKK